MAIDTKNYSRLDLINVIRTMETKLRAAEELAEAVMSESPCDKLEDAVITFRAAGGEE